MRLLTMRLLTMRQEAQGQVRFIGPGTKGLFSGPENF